jgi:hypothetical protein
LLPNVAVDGSFSFFSSFARLSALLTSVVAFWSNSVGFFLLLGGVEGFEDE